MIELDHGIGLRGLPTARRITHNLVLQAEFSSENGTLQFYLVLPHLRSRGADAV
jgi:hypothetical protein